MHFTLGELLLDLVQNAADAGSSTVRITWRERDGSLLLAVEDDGCGMTGDLVARATDPFTTDGVKHPSRSVGLGLAFLRQTAESTGGRFRLDSKPGEGTRVALEAPVDHIDLPPTGDVSESLMLALCSEGPREIEVERERDGNSYTIRKSELDEVLGDLSSVTGRRLLGEFIRSQEEDDGKDDA
ncbi:MAG: sensor histidine kinase [Spirochaetota bacterium]